MRITAAMSVMLHSAIILIAWLGVPSIQPLLTPEQLIEVSLAPDVEPEKPEPKPAPKAAVKPPPPPPPPPAETPEPERVSPQPAPEPEAVPLPKPKPKVAKRPKPKPKPKLKPKPKPRPKQVRRPRPKSKPKPPPKRQDFASVLKTVSKLKKSPPVKKKPAEKKKKPAADFQQQIAAALKRKHTPVQRLTGAVSNSELDAIRRQIEACWNLPAGARDAHNMTVEIRTLMNPDGRVRSASIVDTGRANQDHFYRSMAESALRAVLNPQCQPLKLPLDKYEEWRVMVLNFDPREMY